MVRVVEGITLICIKILRQYAWFLVTWHLNTTEVDKSLELDTDI